MTDEYDNKNKSHDHESAPGKVETLDRGLFDLVGKKDDLERLHEARQDQEVVAAEFEKNEEKKKHSLLQKLHRSNSGSSSSSEEEEGEGEEKKRKKKEKKGITEKIKEKIAGDPDHQKAEEEKVHGHDHHQDTAVREENISTEEVLHHDDQPEDHEKKGFLEKIKEKLPGPHKITDDHGDQEHQIPPPQAEHHHEGEAEEKKGILEKIKEKLPGHHPKSSSDHEDNKDRDAHASH